MTSLRRRSAAIAAVTALTVPALAQTSATAAPNAPAKTTMATAAPTTSLAATRTVPFSKTVSWGRSGDVPVAANYVGDAHADVAVYRPSTGQWWIRGASTITWGRPNDVPAPADFTGDGKAEIAVYRPSTGEWLLRGRGTVAWGRPGDIPMAADYTGDGRADFAVYRPSTGQWWVRGQAPISWGRPGDVPVPANYLGDRRAEKAMYRPSTGHWYILGAPTVRWGSPGDIPVPGRYISTLASRTIWRPGNGAWMPYGPGTVRYGVNGDIPQVGNFGGDGHDDQVVFRPSTGTWWIRTLELPRLAETPSVASSLGSLMRGAGIRLPNVPADNCMGVIANAGDLAARAADVSVMYGRCDATDYYIRWYKIRNGRVASSSSVRVVGTDPSNARTYGDAAGFLTFMEPYDAYPTVLFDVLLYSTSEYYLVRSTSPASAQSDGAASSGVQSSRLLAPGYLISLWSPAKAVTASPAASD